MNGILVLTAAFHLAGAAPKTHNPDLEPATIANRSAAHGMVEETARARLERAQAERDAELCNANDGGLRVTARSAKLAVPARIQTLIAKRDGPHLKLEAPRPKLAQGLEEPREAAPARDS